MPSPSKPPLSARESTRKGSYSIEHLSSPKKFDDTIKRMSAKNLNKTPEILTKEEILTSYRYEFVTPKVKREGSQFKSSDLKDQYYQHVEMLNMHKGGKLSSVINMTPFKTVDFDSSISSLSTARNRKYEL